MRITEEQLSTATENGQWQAWAQQIPASTTIASVGMTAPTTTGTATDLIATEGEYISYASALLAGSVAGWNTGTVTQLGFFPIMRTTVKTGTDITAQRIWVGLFSAVPTGTDTPTANLVAFRYATITDTTAFWRVCVSNGSSTVTTATTVAVAVSTRYVFAIDASTAGVVKFYINGILVLTQTTTLPVTTATLSAYATTTATTTTGKSLAIRKLELEGF